MPRTQDGPANCDGSGYDHDAVMAALAAENERKRVIRGTVHEPVDLSNYRRHKYVPKDTRDALEVVESKREKEAREKREGKMEERRVREERRAASLRKIAQFGDKRDRVLALKEQHPHWTSGMIAHKVGEGCHGGYVRVVCQRMGLYFEKTRENTAKCARELHADGVPHATIASMLSITTGDVERILHRD